MELQQLHANSLVEWSRTIPDYGADTYTARYELRGPSSIDIDCTGSGTTYEVSETAATTADWTPGKYYWNLFVIDGSTRIWIDSGSIEILPDLSSATEYDGRRHCEKVIEAIEAVIEGKASTDQSSVSVGGRSISRMSFAELIAVRDRYRQELRRIEDAEAIRRGYKPRSTIRVRFGD